MGTASFHGLQVLQYSLPPLFNWFTFCLVPNREIKCLLATAFTIFLNFHIDQEEIFWLY